MTEDATENDDAEAVDEADNEPKAQETESTTKKDEN